MLWLQIIAEHTPPWVWLCLALLLFLGARRLKPRRTHLAVAALAPAGFTLLSVATAMPVILSGGVWAPALLWSAAVVGGACTARLRSVELPVHVEGWYFNFAPSWAPLTTYLLLFSLHYGMGIWAGFDPGMSRRLAVVRLVLSAATAGRTAADLFGLLRAVRTPTNSPGPGDLLLEKVCEGDSIRMSGAPILASTAQIAPSVDGTAPTSSSVIVNESGSAWT